MCLVYPVTSPEEKGLMPSRILHASPVVSGTPPPSPTLLRRSHSELLHVGFVGKTAFTLAVSPGSS